MLGEPAIVGIANPRAAHGRAGRYARKLEHIRRNPKVSISISDPMACGGLTARCVIQGDARIIEDDPHETWTSVLPLWRAKEPAIESFVAKRFALPLFFERSIIEVTPRRVLWWRDGDPASPPQVAVREEAA